MNTGTIFSGIGHAGLILWVLVGDWLFPARPADEIIVASVSMMTSAEFDAMQAAATLKPADKPAPDLPAVKPQPRPEAVVPVEPPPEEPPAPEPPPVEAQPPVEAVVPAEPPPSDVPQAAEEQAIQSDSVEIQPAPEAEDIIAPDPVQPETDAQTAETATPAVTEDPAATDVVIQEPTDAAVPEDTGDVTKTEANAEQTAETGMTTSVRPKSRPEKPAPAPEPVEVAADTPPKTPEVAPDQPVDATATEDAIANLLDEAADAPVPDQPATDTAGQDLPQGPPLTGGEMGNISSAIARKWNLGAASTDTLSSMIVIRVSFDEAGNPVDFELLESEGPTQTGIDKLYEAARRAVNRARDDGSLPLPPEKYDTWRVLDLVFDANGMRTR